jgi:UPF0755 protein
MPSAPRVRPALLLLAIVAASALLLAGGGYYAYALRPMRFEPATVHVVVPRGAGPRVLAAELRSKGIDTHPLLLRLALRMRTDPVRIRSGVYQFRSPITLRALVDEIARGDVLLRDIRFIEGWSFQQMREAIAQHPDLLHDTASLAETDLLVKLGAVEPHAEGLFFPSTYFFPPGSSDLEVYRQAHRQLQRLLQDAWQARAADLPYTTPYEALTLASIVEKETGRDADRAMVAAVFVNRLRRGMMLQSDPTTIYGLGERFDGNLRKRELQTDSPYNTYTRRGLPPTPIALPGKASIEAATRPASIDALYFVARGDGSSEFSDDLADHNRAVARYQIGRR